MAVWTTKILPSEAVPTPNFTNQFDARNAKLFASSFQVVDLECNNRGSGELFVLIAPAEDFDLLPGRGLEDRLFRALKPNF